MIKVFISYRRKDAGWARSIANSFGQQQGVEVFLDVDNLPVGDDFPRRLKDEIDSSDVLIVLIGENWVRRVDNNDINNLNDWIRKELIYAIEKQKPLIPVLVDDVHIPRLPQGLYLVNRATATSIRHQSYDDDFANLTEIINNTVEREEQRRVTARLSGLRGVLKIATHNISVIKATQLRQLEDWLQPAIFTDELTQLPESLRNAGFEQTDEYGSIQMRGVSYTAFRFKDKLQLQIGMMRHRDERQVITVYDEIQEDGTGRIIITVFAEQSSIGDDILHILGEPVAIEDEYRLPYISVFFCPIVSETTIRQTYYPFSETTTGYLDDGVDSETFARLFEIRWIGSVLYDTQRLVNIHDQLVTQFGNYQIIHASEYPSDDL